MIYLHQILFDFPGLKPGDKWCLCALRWLEAYQNGVAPEVVLESTHQSALDVIKKNIYLRKPILMSMLS